MRKASKGHQQELIFTILHQMKLEEQYWWAIGIMGEKMHMAFRKKSDWLIDYKKSSKHLNWTPCEIITSKYRLGGVVGSGLRSSRTSVWIN